MSLLSVHLSATTDDRYHSKQLPIHQLQAYTLASVYAHLSLRSSSMQRCSNAMRIL
jgi:hypothetical protein